MEKLPKIAVIMSTYNGEKFIREQLDSILAQEQVDVSIYVFDDKSNDSTIQIIKKYQDENKNIFLTVNEENKNFTYNFIDGLFTFKENQEYDYYAFADQDDFWAKNKLISAINKIKETGECVMYSSNLKLVDENLKPLNNNMMSENYVNKHFDIACKNIVTGCTIVFDKSFKNLATLKYPKNIYLHDYWFALIANYTKDAHFVYDTCPDYILYRQHGANLIGKNKSIGKKLKKKTEIKSTRNLIKRFCELFGNLIIETDKSIFEKLANTDKLKNRFKLFFTMKSNYSTIFKIKMLLNNY